MKETDKVIKWTENVIVADADYVDSVAFNLIVNFERMLGRRIKQADMARWIDCIALDGGLREGQNSTQVVLIHGKSKRGMDNFSPSDFDDELNGKAFSDHLGEFVLSSLAVESIVDADEMFVNVVKTVCSQTDVKRVMIIPNAEKGDLYDQLRHVLQRIDDDKRVTMFAMQPMTGGNFRQEILGYSLMNALGIRGEELEGIG